MALARGQSTKWRSSTCAATISRIQVSDCESDAAGVGTLTSAPFLASQREDQLTSTMPL